MHKWWWQVKNGQCGREKMNTFGWIGKSTTLSRGGHECSRSARRPPRRAGGRRGSLRGGPGAASAHAPRGATTAPARTGLTSPRQASWPEAPPAPRAWQERAGALGGAAASCRWRRRWRRTSPCVRTARRRRTPRGPKEHAPLSRANPRFRSRAQVPDGGPLGVSSPALPCGRQVGLLAWRRCLWGASHPPERPRGTWGRGTTAARCSRRSHGASRLPVVPSAQGWVTGSPRAPGAAGVSRASATAPRPSSASRAPTERGAGLAAAGGQAAQSRAGGHREAP